MHYDVTVPNNDNINHNNKLPKFQVGVFVRVADKRSVYSKGYTTN